MASVPLPLAAHQVLDETRQILERIEHQLAFAEALLALFPRRAAAGGGPGDGLRRLMTAEPPPLPSSPPEDVSRLSVRFRLILAAAFVAGLLFLHFFPGLLRLYPGCPWFRITGYYCPSCGGLRAVRSLAQGRIAEAARFNLVITLLPLVVAMPGRFWRWTMRRWFWGVALALFLLYGIVRNLPWAPFAVLAPPR